MTLRALSTVDFSRPRPWPPACRRCRSLRPSGPSSPCGTSGCPRPARYQYPACAPFPDDRTRRSPRHSATTRPSNLVFCTETRTAEDHPPDHPHRSLTSDEAMHAMQALYQLGYSPAGDAFPLGISATPVALEADHSACRPSAAAVDSESATTAGPDSTAPAGSAYGSASRDSSGSGTGTGRLPTLCSMQPPLAVPAAQHRPAAVAERPQHPHAVRDAEQPRDRPCPSAAPCPTTTDRPPPGSLRRSAPAPRRPVGHDLGRRLAAGRRPGLARSAGNRSGSRCRSGPPTEPPCRSRRSVSSLTLSPVSRASAPPCPWPGSGRRRRSRPAAARRGSARPRGLLPADRRSAARRSAPGTAARALYVVWPCRHRTRVMTSRLPPAPRRRGGEGWRGQRCPRSAWPAAVAGC